jgi:hypothetical protein
MYHSFCRRSIHTLGKITENFQAPQIMRMEGSAPASPWGHENRVALLGRINFKLILQGHKYFCTLSRIHSYDSCYLGPFLFIKKKLHISKYTGILAQ